MQLLFENFRNYINEEAIMDISNLALLHEPDNYNGRIILYKTNPEDQLREAIIEQDKDFIKDNFLIGICMYEIKDEFFQTSIMYAKKGYGPVLYRIMMEISGNKGIAADTNSVSDAAKNVWNNFVHGKGQKYVNVEPLNHNKSYKEDYLNVRITSKIPLNIQPSLQLSKQFINSFPNKKLPINIIGGAASKAIIQSLE